jgi:hypothetical protein
MDYQAFFLSNHHDKFWADDSLDKGRLTPHWGKVSLKKDSEKHPQGNFATCWRGRNTFLMDARAHSIVASILDQDVEILPIEPFRGVEYYFVNVLKELDCLDPENTIWKKGIDIEYQFIPEKLTDSALFMIKGTGSLFTVVGWPGAEFEFKTLVEQAGLTGLKFEEVWSCDEATAILASMAWKSFAPSLSLHKSDIEVQSSETFEKSETANSSDTSEKLLVVNANSIVTANQGNQTESSAIEARERFEGYIYDTFAQEIQSWDAATREDIYAISFFINDWGGDPKQPEVYLSYNTESYWRENIPSGVDPSEAKWNFAYWPQNINASVHDIEGVPLRSAWLDSAGLEDTEGEFDSYTPAVTRAFVAICVRVARRLHENGVITGTFGRTVSIIVHELEYYDAIIEQTRDANPPGATDEFESWYNGQ